MADEKMDLNFDQEATGSTASVADPFAGMAAAAPAPALSFGEEAEAAATPAAPTAAAVAEPEENVLTPEELRQVEEFAKKIDVTNSKAVMTYGVGTQKREDTRERQD